MLELLHSAPGGHFAVRLLDLAAMLTPAKIVKLSAFGFLYASARFTEAYGLWNARVWAEWFALLAGALYLPWEVYEILHKATVLRWTVLFVNLAIVLYMVYIRMSAKTPHRRAMIL